MAKETVLIYSDCPVCKRALSKAAIYTLADPRELRRVRYVGQTSSPRRLYEWIRELYLDEHRMPVMAVIAWTDFRHARIEEHNRIGEFLAQGLPLLNVEAAGFQMQPQLS